MSNGDPFRKVKTGERLKGFPADLYNGMIDTVRVTRQRNGLGAPRQFNTRPDSGRILVKNASGSDQNAFAVLGIDSIVFTPSDNLNGFQYSPMLSCITPAAGHLGKFVVLQEPLKDEAIGWGIVDGLSVVQLSVTAEADLWADVTASDATKLTTAAAGSARILYKPSGTGDLWGLVRLGNVGKSPTFAVKIEKTGGADGNKTTRATWSYAVRAMDGTTVLGTGVTVARPRPFGMMDFQTGTFSGGNAGYGLAFYDGSTLKLWDAGETFETGDCP